MINLTPVPFSISPRRVLIVLVLVSAAFGAASLFGQYLRLFHGVDQYSRFNLIDNFDVDEEANFPTYWNTLLLLIAALLVTVVARLARLAADPMSSRWRFLAVAFFVLSVDEAAGVHEAAGQIVPQTNELGGILFSGWVVLYAVIVVLIGWYVLPLLLSLPRTHRVRFVASAVVYVSGALVVELVESAITIRTGDETWRYQLVSTVQEMSEMIGVALFVWALLRLIESRDSALQATIAVRDAR